MLEQAFIQFADFASMGYVSEEPNKQTQEELDSKTKFDAKIGDILNKNLTQVLEEKVEQKNLATEKALANSIKISKMEQSSKTFLQKNALEFSKNLNKEGATEEELKRSEALNARTDKKYAKALETQNALEDNQSKLEQKLGTSLENFSKFSSINPEEALQKTENIKNLETDLAQNQTFFNDFKTIGETNAQDVFKTLYEEKVQTVTTFSKESAVGKIQAAKNTEKLLKEELNFRSGVLNEIKKEENKVKSMEMANRQALTDSSYEGPTFTKESIEAQKQLAADLKESISSKYGDDFLSKDDIKQDRKDIKATKESLINQAKTDYLKDNLKDKVSEDYLSKMESNNFKQNYKLLKDELSGKTQAYKESKKALDKTLQKALGDIALNSNLSQEERKRLTEKAYQNYWNGTDDQVGMKALKEAQKTIETSNSEELKYAREYYNRTKALSDDKFYASQWEDEAKLNSVYEWGKFISHEEVYDFSGVIESDNFFGALGNAIAGQTLDVLKETGKEVGKKFTDFFTSFHLERRSNNSQPTGETVLEPALSLTTEPEYIEALKKLIASGASEKSQLLETLTKGEGKEIKDLEDSLPKSQGVEVKPLNTPKDDIQDDFINRLPMLMPTFTKEEKGDNLTSLAIHKILTSYPLRGQSLYLLYVPHLKGYKELSDTESKKENAREVWDSYLVTGITLPGMSRQTTNEVYGQTLLSLIAENNVMIEGKASIKIMTDRGMRVYSQLSRLAGTSIESDGSNNLVPINDKETKKWFDSLKYRRLYNMSSISTYPDLSYLSKEEGTKCAYLQLLDGRYLQTEFFLQERTPALTEKSKFLGGSGETKYYLSYQNYLLKSSGESITYEELPLFKLNNFAVRNLEMSFDFSAGSAEKLLELNTSVTWSSIEFIRKKVIPPTDILMERTEEKDYRLASWDLYSKSIS